MNARNVWRPIAKHEMRVFALYGTAVARGHASAERLAQMTSERNELGRACRPRKAEFLSNNRQFGSSPKIGLCPDSPRHRQNRFPTRIHGEHRELERCLIN